MCEALFTQTKHIIHCWHSTMDYHRVPIKDFSTTNFLAGLSVTKLSSTSSISIQRSPEYNKFLWGLSSPGGYSPYGQQRTEEEEVDEIKTQIRQTKLDSLQSTQNSLAAIQRADKSAQTTLNKLREQSR